METNQIRRRVYVNLFALGLQQYAVFFAIPPKSISKKAKMREVLLRAPFVELLIEVSGRYHFGLVLTVRSAFDLERFFDFVSAQSKIEVTDLALQARTGWYYFGARYLCSSGHPEPIHVVPTGDTRSLSSSESEALYAYAASSDGNRSRMARELRVPPATLQYQISNLRRSGVVLGVRYQIAPEMTGFQPYRVLLNTNYPASSNRLKIYNWCKQAPYVVSLMQGVGPWQYELRVEAPNQTAVASTVDDLTERCADFIHHAEIVPVVKVLKMQLCPDREVFSCKQGYN
jgi:DNA-binding Lrp family transcriptional regulator